MEEKKVIKVLHSVCGLKSGGVEQMILNYYKNMDRSRFQFDIVYQHEPVDTCLRQFAGLGCSTFRVPSKSRHPIGNFIQTLKIMKMNNYDIVHAHMTYMNFITLFCAALSGIKIRISHSHTCEKPILPKVLCLVCKYLTKLTATDFLACGHYAAAALYGDKIAVSRRVSILHNAIDYKKFCFNEGVRENERNLLGVEGKFVIGHIGRFVKIKNQEFLIDVFSQVYKNDKNTVLILVGAGEMEDQIRDKVSRLGLMNAVIILNVREDISSLYQAFDLFVLPSYSEGLGIVLIEAQATGLQCIASDTVSPETNISDVIHYLPLEAGPAYWAKKIIETRGNSSRKTFNMNSESINYDIDKSVEKLESYYVQRFRDVKRG
jgi:glycosyltransferase involved in cell wall biosynthesis